MFSKKYVFETRKTRLRRLFLNIFALGVFSTFILLSFSFYLPIFAENQNQITADFLKSNSPEVISIFTGDKGRIPFGIELAIKHKSSKVLISGVYENISLKTVLNKQNTEKAKDILVNHGIDIEIDYYASNTIENVINTLRYVDQNMPVKNVVIISSNYHIFRASLLANSINKNKDLNFYFYSDKIDYNKTQNLKRIIFELPKIVKSIFVSLIWDV